MNYLAAAKQALAYVKGQMDIGASNKLELSLIPNFATKWMCAGSLLNKGTLQMHVEKDLAYQKKMAEKYNIPVPGNKEYLDSLAMWAKHFGCGNCGAQSALAFIHLRDNGVRPLDWMSYDEYSHAFVIIGRSRDSDPAKFHTWGKDSVLCDPWKDIAVSTYHYLGFTNKRLELIHRVE